MYILIFLGIICTAYIIAFKENFKQEQIEKVVPFFALVIVGVLTLAIITSFLKR